MEDDREIVRQVQASRDEQLYPILVERHQRRVFHVVLSVLGPAHAGEAEEIAQEVFLEAWLPLDGFRGDAAFGTWLYWIAWNRAADQRRLARMQRPHLPESALNAIAQPHGLLDQALQGERAARVHEAVEALPELYRRLVRMDYWLGCSLAEIRELTGIPEGTAKSYLARRGSGSKGDYLMSDLERLLAIPDPPGFAFRLHPSRDRTLARTGAGAAANAASA